MPDTANITEFFKRKRTSPEKEKKYTCNYCQHKFSSSSSLSSHKKKAKYCILSRNIIIFCKKCGVSSSSIDFFKSHILTCQGACDYEIDKEPEKEVGHISSVKDKNNLSVAVIKEKREEIPLVVEKEEEEPEEVDEEYKASYEYIATQNPNNITFNLFEAPNKVTLTPPFSSFTDKKDPFYLDTKQLHPLFGPEPSDTDKENRKSYISSLITYTAEKEFKNNYDLDHIRIAMSVLLKEIKNFNKYVDENYVISTCRELMSLRFQILRYISFKEYSGIFDSHFEVIGSVIRGISDTNHPLRDHTKWVSIIEIYLFLPHHFKIENYDESMIQIDKDIIINALKTRITDTKELLPFDIDKVSYRFNTPFLLFLPFEDILKLYLINRYGQNNLIYVPNSRNTPSDPFSFYSLKEIKQGKRYWELQDRLFDFVDSITPSLIEYYVGQFRDIYLRFFDTTFYGEKVHGRLSHQLSMTVKSIIIISSFYAFARICQKIIAGWASYTPTENDIFDSFEPNLRLKIEYDKKRTDRKSEKELILSNLSLLFDDISNETIEEELLSKYYANRSDLIKPY